MFDVDNDDAMIMGALAADVTLQLHIALHCIDRGGIALYLYTQTANSHHIYIYIIAARFTDNGD